MRRFDDLTVIPGDELLARFVVDALENASIGVEMDLSKSPVLANAAAARVIAICTELRRRGIQAQKSLLDLLSHSDLRVRVRAAGHVAEFAPEDAKRTMQEVAATGGLPGRSAAYALKAWEVALPSPCPHMLYPGRSELPEALRWPPVSSAALQALGTVSRRLEPDSPELAEAFQRASLDKRREVAMRATEFALDEVGLAGLDPIVTDAQHALRFEVLPARDAERSIRALAAKRDEEAARLRDDPDEDQRALAIAYERDARALACLAIALSGDSTRLDEVIHEALAVEDQPEGLIEFLVGMFREEN